MKRTLTLMTLMTFVTILSAEALAPGSVRIICPALSNVFKNADGTATGITVGDRRIALDSRGVVFQGNVAPLADVSDQDITCVYGPGAAAVAGGTLRGPLPNDVENCAQENVESDALLCQVRH